MLQHNLISNRITTLLNQKVNKIFLVIIFVLIVFMYGHKSIINALCVKNLLILLQKLLQILKKLTKSNQRTCYKMNMMNFNVLYVDLETMRMY